MDPTAFKHLDAQELLRAQNAIRSKTMIIQKALRKKNSTAKESSVKSKPQTELSKLADMFAEFWQKNSAKLPILTAFIVLFLCSFCI